MGQYWGISLKLLCFYSKNKNRFTAYTRLFYEVSYYYISIQYIILLKTLLNNLDLKSLLYQRFGVAQ
nr:MAG TPA: hypothetical protein [Caudoviricetes sp.]